MVAAVVVAWAAPAMPRLRQLAEPGALLMQALLGVREVALRPARLAQMVAVVVVVRREPRLPTPAVLAVLVQSMILRPEARLDLAVVVVAAVSILLAETPDRTGVPGGFMALAAVLAVVMLVARAGLAVAAMALRVRL